MGQSEIGSEALGRAVAYRLAVREEAGAQVKVINAIAHSSVASQLILCGSAGLHGGFIQGRRVSRLDFLARPDTAMRLCAELRHSETPLRKLRSSQEYAAIVKTALTSQLEVAIRIYPRYTLSGAADLRSYRAGSLHSDPVSMSTLPELVLAKLAHLYLRDRVTDYWDIWMALARYPEIIAPVRELIAQRSNSGSSHVPPYPFDSAYLLKRFRRMEAAWLPALEGVLDTKPEFDTVSADLLQLSVLDTQRTDL